MSTEPSLTDQAVDELSIRKALQALADAWNRHDAEAFSRVFAEDADFTNVLGTSAYGRAAIAAFHAPIFATVFRDSLLKSDGAKVRFVRQDVAAVDQWWEMTGARALSGQKIPFRKGLLNLLMTKQGTRWVVSVMHNLELPAMH